MSRRVSCSTITDAPGQSLALTSDEVRHFLFVSDPNPISESDLQQSVIHGNTSRLASLEAAIRNSIRAGRNSLRRLTSTTNASRRVSVNIEALPRLDNYRNIVHVQSSFRPTLEELHEYTVEVKVNQLTNQFVILSKVKSFK